MIWLYAPEARSRSTLQLAPVTSQRAATLLESLVKDHSHHLDCPWQCIRCIVATTLTASGGSIMEDGLVVVMDLVII